MLKISRPVMQITYSCDFGHSGRKTSLPSERGRKRIAISEDSDGGNRLRCWPASAGCGYVVHTLEFWRRVSTQIRYRSSVLFLHRPIHGFIINANNGRDKRLRLTCKKRYLRWIDGYGDLRQSLNVCLPKQDAGQHCDDETNGDHFHSREPP